MYPTHFVSQYWVPSNVQEAQYVAKPKGKTENTVNTQKAGSSSKWLSTNGV